MDRRTTVVADDGDLELLAREARERGLSLGRMLGEVISEKAHELRQQCRPRVGMFHSGSGTGIAELMEADDPAARPFRS